VVDNGSRFPPRPEASMRHGDENWQVRALPEGRRRAHFGSHVSKGLVLLDQFGEVYKRDPGLEIRRAVLEGGDVYEITLWQQFKTYATVAKPDAQEQT
jgi:hypothetical protein